MSDKDQISSSPHAMYGNATMYYDSPTTEGQGGLFDSTLPSSQAYVKNDVDSVMEFLDVWQQRCYDNTGASEVKKGLYHQRQSLMVKPNIGSSTTLPILKGDTLIPFVELGFCRSEDHLSQDLGTGIIHDALDVVGPLVSMKVAGQHQAWVALSHNTETKMADIVDECLPWGEVSGYHDKRTLTPAHAIYPPSTDLDYGHAPEIGFGSSKSCLLGRPLSPSAHTYAGDNHVRSSISAPPRNESRGPTISSFMSSGIKRYRCECGYESARMGDIYHHLESLQHSKRKYGCSCGKKFTRHDSLNRHKKRCRN